MLMPSIFGDNLFDEMMDFPWEREFHNRKLPASGKNQQNWMKTDVKELSDHYEVDIDLPGFKKEEIAVELENGYLTVRAAKSENHDEKREDGTYIRRERFTGSCSRSFYIGETVLREEVRARYEDGILKLEIPKKDQKAVEQNKYIAIEG